MPPIKNDHANDQNCRLGSSTNAVHQNVNDREYAKNMYFLKLDIDSFYPSVTPRLLNDSITWAATLTDINELEKAIINIARKTFLYHKNNIWIN